MKHQEQEYMLDRQIEHVLNAVQLALEGGDQRIPEAQEIDHLGFKLHELLHKAGYCKKGG